MSAPFSARPDTVWNVDTSESFSRALNSAPEMARPTMMPMRRTKERTPDPIPALSSGTASIPAELEMLNENPWPKPAITSPTISSGRPLEAPRRTKHTMPPAMSA